MNLDGMNNMEVSVEENIEMELFSPEEPCGPDWRCLEHPLVQVMEEEEPGQVQGRSSRDTENLQPPGAQEDTVIEMEVLQSLKIRKVREHKASSRPKWKKMPPQKSRFVVKDVLFLPSDQDPAQIDSLVLRTGLSLVKARMTVDHSWTETQMDTRLRMVLRRELEKTEARKVHFTYLQCVQSSRSLFVPSAPEDGWTGANVLQISALGPLYVLLQQDTSSPQKLQDPC